MAYPTPTTNKNTPLNVTFNLSAAGAECWESGVGGFVGSLNLYAPAGDEVFLWVPDPPDASLAFTACFSSAPCRAGFSFSMEFQRGGARAYLRDDAHGNSAAASQVAGAAVLVRQYFTDGFFPGGYAVPGDGFIPSSALLKAVLINSATPGFLTDTFAAFFGTYPESRANSAAFVGFGVPSLPRGLSFSRLGAGAGALSRDSGQLPVMLLPGTVISRGGVAPAPAVEPALRNGEAHEYCVLVRPAPDEWAARVPLLLTLVWTDPPGSPLAERALVNNLDLIVTPPGRAAVYGNADPLLASSPPDVLNNVERLAFPAALYFFPGRSVGFNVTVRGTSVVLAAPQRYSLVVTGPGLQLAGAALCAVPLSSPSPSPSPTPRRRPPGGTLNNFSYTSTGAMVGYSLGGALLLAIISAALYHRRCLRAPKRAEPAAPAEANDPIFAENNILFEMVGISMARGRGARLPQGAPAEGAADPVAPDDNPGAPDAPPPPHSRPVVEW